MHKKNLLKASSAVIFVGLLAVSSFAIGQNVKLNPIKPALKQKVALTDEQQGILAVRSVKPSVVNIFGNRTVNSLTSDASAVSTISGTCFIISADGMILTNSHVVDEKDIKYFVELLDGSQYEATVLGQDPYNDIALLKINAKNLSVANLGDSAALETGQTVFAIGNSLGKYQNTVTRGVVSGLSRAVGIGDSDSLQPRLQNLIQTDAAINPGNSGGPLVNMAGEVVGINTLIDTGARGVGFAVAINTVKNSVEQLKAGNKVSRPFVGLEFITVSKAVQAGKKLPVDQGAYVNFVTQNSPAAFAGLIKGDVVLKVNSEKLTEKNEFDAVILKYKAGDQLFFTVLRNGQEMVLPIILGEFK